MKEEGSAITLGERGKSDKISKKTKIGAYGVIGLLLLFVIWINLTDRSLSFDVEKVASITSYAVGATTTDSFGFFRKKKYPDMNVDILSVGVTDDNGAYRENDTLTTSSIGALRIKVTNKGSRVSSDWTFKITLPTKDNYVYVSPTQEPLLKEEEKIFIFTFDKLVATSSAIIKVEIETDTLEKYTKNNQTSKEVEIF